MIQNIAQDSNFSKNVKPISLIGQSEMVKVDMIPFIALNLLWIMWQIDIEWVCSTAHAYHDYCQWSRAQQGVGSVDLFSNKKLGIENPYETTNN